MKWAAYSILHHILYTGEKHHSKINASADAASRTANTGSNASEAHTQLHARTRTLNVKILAYTVSSSLSPSEGVIMDKDQPCLLGRQQHDEFIAA